MRVVVLFTPAPPDAPPEELDGLVQRDAVSAALRRAGHEVLELPFDLDLARAHAALRAAAPDAVFNLVESVAGSDRLAQLAPSLLETMGLPFTGCGAEAMTLAANKLLAKRILGAHGLPTPPWLEGHAAPAQPLARGERLIVKSAFEHGSVGLDDDAIWTLDDPGAVRARLREVCAARGGLWFAERFVEGRELNLSLIAVPGGAEVLPPAEIRFRDFGDGKPHIVGYAAKWQHDTFEYAHTTVAFDFPEQDAALLARLRTQALACWQAFGLAGYARVDFRVDTAGDPWVLEVNTNPCIAPDAGFVAAAARAGIPFDDLVQRLVDRPTA